MKKLRLLYIDFDIPYLIKDIDYPIGGAAVEWYAWINGLIANNHEIGMLTFKGAKEYIGKSVDFDIVETYGLDEGIPKLRWLYKRYPAIFRAAKQYNPNYLIQECAGFITGLMAFIGKRLNIPFVYRVANDMDTDNRYKDRLSRFEQVLYQYGLKHANSIICQNKYQYENMIKKYPLKKIAIIHNPFYYNSELPEIKKSTEREYVAWLGLFQHQKNLPALFEVAKNLKDIEFRITGEPQNHLDDVTKAALNLLKQCKNVKFMGYLKRKEIIPFLSQAYALLNTSHYEGFSNTFLESFLSGTPIVTTCKVDPDNIIANNNLGSVTKDYAEIPDLLVTLMKNRDYDDIAQRCRKYVLEHHNPKILAQKFVESL